MAQMPEKLWRGLNAFAVHSLFHTMNLFDRMSAPQTERIERVEIARDLSYGPDATDRWRKLDVWRPAEPACAPRPAVLFVHGGGFRTMSKRTHWAFARALARMGYVVFTIDYRLGPEQPFPAPLQDVAEAYLWVLEHASAHGADASRLVLAGESAGANLISALSWMTCQRRPEPWAQRVFEAGVVPQAVLAMCGILQVSDVARFERAGAPRLVMGPLRDAQQSYLPGGAAPSWSRRELELADPLVLFERDEPLERELPAFFAPVGTKDPLVEDARRLEQALTRHGATCQAPVYEGGAHSFMAFMWTERARQCWRDVRAFLDRFAPIGEASEPAPASHAQDHSAGMAASA